MVDDRLSPPTKSVDSPLVSVVCTTYQHERYVAHALDGFLKQRTDFPFEIIVHDDASTDGTVKVIREYAQRFPELIVPFVQPINLYSLNQRPWPYCFAKSRGRYIALCEGDDYWTDPLKLQKQVNRLEANQGLALSFHAVSVLRPDGELVEDRITKVPDQYRTRMDLALRGNYIHTPSVVFRNLVKDYPPEFLETPISDFFNHMLLAGYGNLDYMSDNMAVYREGVGVWSSLNRYRRNLGTAICHGALATYYARTQEPELAEVFNRRIRSFIERFPTELNAVDLIPLLRFDVDVQTTVLNALLDVDRQRMPLVPLQRPIGQRLVNWLRSTLRN